MITDDLASSLKAVKESDGTAESETIRRALREYFARRPVNLDDTPKNREWLRSGKRRRPPK